MNKKIAVFLVAALVLAPVPTAKAQQTKKLPRIGYLALRAGPNENDEGFLQGLRDLSYIKDQNTPSNTDGRQTRWTASPVWQRN